MKKPRRKRFAPKKRRRSIAGNVNEAGNQPTEATECPSSSSASQLLPESSTAGMESSPAIAANVTFTEDSHPSSVLDDVKHDCDLFKSPTDDGAASNPSGAQEGCTNLVQPPLPPPAPVELLMEVKRKLDLFLNRCWLSSIEEDSIRVVRVSPGRNAAIQRSLVFLVSGNVELFVHCQKVAADPYMMKSGPCMPLCLENINDFVDRAVTIVGEVGAMKICSGVDDDKFKPIWSICAFGVTDKNPYLEERYEETFRTIHFDETGGHFKCIACHKFFSQSGD